MREGENVPTEDSLENAIAVAVALLDVPSRRKGIPIPPPEKCKTLHFGL